MDDLTEVMLVIGKPVKSIVFSGKNFRKIQKMFRLLLEITEFISIKKRYQSDLRKSVHFFRVKKTVLMMHFG